MLTPSLIFNIVPWLECINIYYDYCCFLKYRVRNTCRNTRQEKKKYFIKGNFAIFYMLAKYVPGDIKYIFTKIYRHISTNNEANRKFVILISNFSMGCDVLAR